MKGYPVPDGWCGWIDGRYMLFDTEDEYKAVYREQHED